MPQLTFTCYAKCVPQGSSRGFNVKGRIIITSANKKLKPFRQELTSTAMQAMRDHDGLLADKGVAVGISLDIYYRKPPSVPKKRIYMTVKPDLDKLVRSNLDSLTGVVWADDSQVVELNARKHYTSGPDKVEISIYTITKGDS